MKITKNKGLFITVMLIIAVMYSAIILVIPFRRSIGFWNGYAFSMLAVMVTATVGILAFSKGEMRSKFYGVPLVIVAWGYLVTQLIVGILQMILQFIPYQFMIVLNVILLGACFIGLIAVSVATGEIERIDAKIKEKVFYVKSLQGEIEILIPRISDNALQAAIKSLVDTIRFSDPMSSTQLSGIENRIEIKAANLVDNISSVDTDTALALCDELQQLFAERNRKCKLLK